MQQAGDDETIEVDFDEIMAEVADLIDSVRYGTDGDTGLTAAAGQFANPYHDERGRFAPKNTGRRVPTVGIADPSDSPEPTLADRQADHAVKQASLKAMFDGDGAAALELAQSLFDDLSLVTKDGQTFSTVAESLGGSVEGTGYLYRDRMAVVEGRILDDEGKAVGEFGRRLYRGVDGAEVTMHHAYFFMYAGQQGQGVGAAFLAASEARYREAGINKITVSAEDVGGYAWARAGFDFAHPEWAERVAERFTPEERSGLPAAPTPMDFAMIGYTPGATTWPGKEKMIGSAWVGVKYLDPELADEPVAVAASAGTDRLERLRALGDLHHRYSIDHAEDAPPATGSEFADAGLWNLDLASPPGIEAEFMAAAARILAAAPFATKAAAGQFANPFHDERGRFAPKDTGRRVPTGGIPEKTSLRAAPVKVVGAWGTFTKRKSPAGRMTKWTYQSDARGTTTVTIGDDSGWTIDDPDLEAVVFASQAHDSRVTVHFTERVAWQAATTIGDPWHILVAQKDRFMEGAGSPPSPGWYMPAATIDNRTEYLVAHEHGHLAHYLAQDDLNQNREDIVRYLNDERQRIVFEEELGLSFYALTSPLEVVAESYAQACLDPANLSEVARGAMEIAGVKVPRRVDSFYPPEAIAASGGAPDGGLDDEVHAPRSDVQLLREDGLLVDVWDVLPAIDWAAWGHPDPDQVQAATEFANPNHDELGRFARKGEGRAVRTRGIPEKTSIADTSYRGTHQPSPEGPPANNLLANNDDPDLWGIPDDVYDHPEWYTGAPGSEWARETIRVLREYRGKPDDTPITVYRAAPGPINPGDWVTLARGYAEDHALGVDPSQDLPIQEITVPVATIRFAGDDLSEFGYFPERFRDGS